MKFHIDVSTLTNPYSVVKLNDYHQIHAEILQEVILFEVKCLRDDRIKFRSFAKFKDIEENISHFVGRYESKDIHLEMKKDGIRIYVVNPFNDGKITFSRFRPFAHMVHDKPFKPMKDKVSVSYETKLKKLAHNILRELS